MPVFSSKHTTTVWLLYVFDIGTCYLIPEMFELWNAASPLLVLFSHFIRVITSLYYLVLPVDEKHLQIDSP